MKKIIIIFLLLSVGLSQVTLTEEEFKNIANNIIELQAQVDSLTIDTNLKAKEIDLLNKKVTLLEKDISMTEKKAKLVKASWYENKWLYFGYGGVLSYALISALNALDDIF